MDRRSKYSINVINETFVTLLKKKKLEDITVTEICKLADINRGTFYKYYFDVYDLHDKMEKYLINDIREIFEKHAEGKDLKSFLLDLFTFAEKNYETKLKSFSSDRIEKFVQNGLRQANPFLSKYIDEMLPNNNPKHKNITKQYIVGGVLTNCVSWLYEDKRESAEVIVDKLYDLILKSLKN